MKHPASSFSWVRKLADFLPEMTEIPLFGNAPPYDWQHLASVLSTRLETKDLSLRPAEQAWREAGAVKKGLGRNPFVASVLLSPLGFPLYFAMSGADINKFLSWMMHGISSKNLVSEPLKAGFSRFLLLEVLDAACKIGPLQKLTPQLEETSELPDEPSFCIDVEISYGENSCWGRLILPSSFRKKWVEHFSQTPSEYASSPAAKAMELIIGVKTGSVLLPQSEWEALKLGDVLILDRSSYDARKQTGIATLNIGSIPLFQVKIKQNKLELLDFAMTQEENMEEKSQAGEMVQPAEESSGSIKDIPLNVCVELARLRITLDHLMHLNPGNTLELPIHPDQGVSLTVNGKKVGKAELIYIGEALGIRILELGSQE